MWPWARFRPSNGNVGGEHLPYTFSRNPIVGYRTWRISSDYHGLALRSLHVDYVWQVDNQAACHPDGAHPSLHEPPSPGLSCSCGFYCVEASTKVLTHDLRWVPAGDLRVGDRLYATEEYGVEKEPYQRRYSGEWRTVDAPGERARRFQDSYVTAHKIVQAPTVRIEMDNGDSLVCTVDHPVLARKWRTGDNRSWHWVKASQLTSDYELIKLLEVWDEERTWEAGWLSGMYDGEGHFGNSSQRHRSPTIIGIGQRQGPVFDEVQRLLRDRKFEFTVTGGGGTHGDVGNLRLTGGYAEVYRLLGTIRPMRLLPKLGYPETRPLSVSRVHAVTPAGEQAVATMSTTSRTYLTEGYVSHNCQLPDHPLDEWEHMVRGRVRATGTVSLTGRVVRCERGYKAQYASIQSPVIIEANCSHLHGTCTNPVTTLALPEGHVRSVYGHCGEHGVEFMSDPPVVVDAALWMEQACRELEARYPGVEFIYVDWNEYEEVEDGKHW